MDIEVNKRINDSTTVKFSFKDERDLKEAILKVVPLIYSDTKCGRCSSVDVGITANKAKDEKGAEFIFVKNVCRKCGASQNFGEYVTPKGTLFVKREWVERKAKPETKEPEGWS